MDTNIQLAKFSENYKYIIDSEGQKVNLNDPRVMHIWTYGTNDHASKMIVNAFRKQGWRAMYTGGTTNETLQHARNLISGRECLVFVAVVGNTYRDIMERRPENEISVYYCLDEEGPCENGAWPLVWETFGKRIGRKNIVYCAHPSMRNNYVGGGELFATRFTIAVTLGTILEEAEMALKVLAKDKESAIKLFQAESEKLIESTNRGFLAIELSLKKWAKAIAAIPLKEEIKKTPKVLLLGGANVLWIHHPVSEYLVEQDVVPKVVDFMEIISLLEAHPIIRHGVRRGLVNPQKQYKFCSMLASLFNRQYKFTEGFRAITAWRHLWGIDFVQRHCRKLAEKSGLLYSAHISFVETILKSHQYVSVNTGGETSGNIGRFLISQNANVYDGYINLGSFDCQPAMNTQALLRTISSKYDVPYASLDCEGPNISANQRRLIETVAVQAKRLREERNKRN